MKNEKDKWEEFKNLPETYETNDNLVPKVKYEIFREKHTKRRFHWQAIAASVTWLLLDLDYLFLFTFRIIKMKVKMNENIINKMNY